MEIARDHVNYTTVPSIHDMESQDRSNMECSTSEYREGDNKLTTFDVDKSATVCSDEDPGALISLKAPQIPVHIHRRSCRSFPVKCYNGQLLIHVSKSSGVCG